MSFPFKARDRSTVSLAVTDASGSRQFNMQQGDEFAVRVANLGAKTAFVRFGPSDVTAAIPSGATKGDVALPAGAVEIFSTQQPYLAAICATGETTTLYITPGEGM